MPKMECYCGTKCAEIFEIELDDYSALYETSATDEQMSEAFKLLRDTMTDVHFADDHYRNNSAVNACIALHVMGYDAEGWFENFCAEQGKDTEHWYLSDLDSFMTHVERVCGYLSKWGPRGNEGNALNYSI